MKRAITQKSKISALLFILTVIFLISSCSPVNYSGIKSTNANNNQKSTVYNYNQNQIKNLEDRIEILNNFCIEIDRLEKYYVETYHTNLKGFENAKYFSEQKPHTEALTIIYGEWLEDLSNIEMHPLLKTAYDYYFESIQQKRLAMQYHIEENLWRFDRANYRDLAANNNLRKEIKGIMAELNKEAESLEISLPYPGYEVVLSKEGNS